MIVPDLPGKESQNQYSNISYFTKGGMGEIYKGFDTINKTDVAIKLIHIADTDEEQLLNREILISTKLSGKNIVTTHHTGKVNISGNDFLFIVQNFYQNGNLRSNIKPGIDISECFRMMKDILNGLESAHKLIVHRDLKPENILIDMDGTLLITDFGLAKYIDEKTRTKSFKGSGTIPYMAPECWLFETNAIPMDIYSLGILFYEMLTGQLPFNAKTETEWRDFHLYQQLPEISLIRPDIPIKIKQVIAKMTQKRVSERYKSVGEILIALDEAIEQSGEERKEAERLAAIGHSTVQQIQAEKLKAKQVQDELNEYKKMLNYHITELFEKLKATVHSINTSLETTKIKIDEKHYDGSLSNKRLTLSFNNKSINFNFSEHNFIEKYEKYRIEQNINYQKQQHGFVISNAPESIFRKKAIIYLGKAETNYQNPFLEVCFGFNLALVKPEAELYGKWYIASFSDSGFSRSSRKSFALELNDFLTHFESSFSTHTLTVDYHELQDSDLSRSIEEILR